MLTPDAKSMVFLKYMDDGEAQKNQRKTKNKIVWKKYEKMKQKTKQTHIHIHTHTHGRAYLNQTKPKQSK